MKTIEELDFAEMTQVSLMQKSIAMGYAQSKDIAAYVVLYRVLGSGKDFAMICMAELGRRRSLGDDFIFEDFINTEVKKVAQPKEGDFGIAKSFLNIKNIANIVTAARKEK